MYLQLFISVVVGLAIGSVVAPRLLPAMDWSDEL